MTHASAAPQTIDSDTDTDTVNVGFMQQALSLARAAQYRTSPNPSVGCVLVLHGKVIGQGATEQSSLNTGGAHAEVVAIRDALAKGYATQGATAYVTLEPCAHTGRTGPCAQALIVAGVSRLVAALIDPNPLTAGAGLRQLQAAGIQVDVGLCGAEAAAQNRGFLKRVTTGMPWLRLKVATSLDGFVALPNGHSQWLTGAAARADGHQARASACAVVTGIGTLLADNPRLTVRDFDTPRQPQRIVLDTHLRTPVDAQVFEPQSLTQSPVTLIHASTDTARQAALEAAGARLVRLPTKGDAIDLHAFMLWAGAQPFNTLHLEAGSALNGAFLSAGWADEVLLYQAPCLLGAGMSWAKLGGDLAQVDDAPRLRLQSADRLGDDVRLVLHTPTTWQATEFRHANI